MPVLGRFRTYGVELTPSAQSYARALWSHPAVAELEQLVTREPPIAEYDATLRRAGA